MRFTGTGLGRIEAQTRTLSGLGGWRRIWRASRRKGVDHSPLHRCDGESLLGLYPNISWAEAGVKFAQSRKMLERGSRTRPCPPYATSTVPDQGASPFGVPRPRSVSVSESSPRWTAGRVPGRSRAQAWRDGARPIGSRPESRPRETGLRHPAPTEHSRSWRKHRLE